MKPYYSDDLVQLYHGDYREVLPELRTSFALVVADPPYGETSLAWDRWPDKWPALMADYGEAMWCFGSMRMFLNRFGEFEPYWNLSQDIVWEKHNGTGFAADRFRRVHEHVVHLYRGGWNTIHHETPREEATFDAKGRTRGQSTTTNRQHTGVIGTKVYEDDGTRLARSVLRYPSVRRGIHPTEKPLELLERLIRYGCPPTGAVLDPFAGSASTLVAARDLGRRSIGIEIREEQCEKAAQRLSRSVLDFSHHPAGPYTEQETTK